MRALYDSISLDCNRRIMHVYSTSFSLGARLFGLEIRKAIGAIYGYVRVADEIVDTFHDAPQEDMLAEFDEATWKAIERRISTNPVLHAFQEVVHRYNMDYDHIKRFLRSMEMDLTMKTYDRDMYDEYILGSAEVVGLMCLHVFVKGDTTEYERLKPAAMKLGSAFQKVNFLRDLQEDSAELGRRYFPNLPDLKALNPEIKHEIEQEIQAEFDIALQGIKQLPREARLGVYVAYIYYRHLLQKIKRKSSAQLLSQRVRIPNAQKIALLFWSMLKFRFRMI